MGPEDHHTYRRIVGRLQFLIPRRPDLLFAQSQLTQALAAPTAQDWQAMKRAVRYLTGARDHALTHQVKHRREVFIDGFSDADWAGDRSTRRSMTSWAIFFDGVLLSAGARRQNIVAQSSCEAEYIAAVTTAAEMKYLAALFAECGIEVKLRLYVDSTAAVGVAQRRGLQRMRHLDVRFLWLQQEVHEKRLAILRVPGNVNRADAGTKPTDRATHERCREQLRVLPAASILCAFVGNQ